MLRLDVPHHVAVRGVGVAALRECAVRAEHDHLVGGAGHALAVRLAFHELSERRADVHLQPFLADERGVATQARQQVVLPAPVRHQFGRRHRLAVWPADAAADEVSCRALVGSLTAAHIAAFGRSANIYVGWWAVIWFDRHAVVAATRRYLVDALCG